jgi:hypothetical protein
LRSTIVLAVLDAEGNDSGERAHYGTDCGTRATGWTVAEINRRVRDARRAELAAKEEAAAAREARRFEALVTWAGETLGIPDRKALRDFSIFKQFCESDAYTAFKAAEEAGPADTETKDEERSAAPQQAAENPHTGNRPAKSTNRPTVTAQAAAQLARVTITTIRTWCRQGLVAATKVRGRWAVSISSLRALLAALNPAPRRRPADRLRKGENIPAKTGRAARVRIGHHMSPARRDARLAAVVARTNAGRLTAAEYLTDVLGADQDFVHSYASPFGKAIATAWRAAYGADPKKKGLALVNRRLIPVFAYRIDDLPILQAAALAYPRTAELVGA